jgi:hypothetical protein
VEDALRSFVRQMCTDADFALGLADAYLALRAEVRDAMLTSLEQDVAALKVDAASVFAPLFAVETDLERRSRLFSLMGEVPQLATTAYAESEDTLVLLEHVYADFAGGTRIRMQPGHMECETLPLCSRAALVHERKLQQVPLEDAIDRLALAIVRSASSERAPQVALVRYAHLFQRCAA